MAFDLATFSFAVCLQVTHTCPPTHMNRNTENSQVVKTFKLWAELGSFVISAVWAQQIKS